MRNTNFEFMFIKLTDRFQSETCKAFHEFQIFTCSAYYRRHTLHQGSAQLDRIGWIGSEKLIRSNFSERATDPIQNFREGHRSDPIQNFQEGHRSDPIF